MEHIKYLPLHRVFCQQDKPCDCFQHFILLLTWLCDPGSQSVFLCTAVMTLGNRSVKCLTALDLQIKSSTQKKEIFLALSSHELNIG